MDLVQVGYATLLLGCSAELLLLDLPLLLFQVEKFDLSRLLSSFLFVLTSLVLAVELSDFVQDTMIVNMTGP